MNILYSCLSQSWGGMELFALTALKQLQNRGHDVELICYKDSRIHKEAISMVIQTHSFRFSSYFHPLQVRKLKRILKRGEYDLIHTQFSKDLFLIIPAVKLARLNIPVFLTKQVGSYIVKKDFIHKWIYKRLTCAFAISEVIRKNLLDTCPLDISKIRLLHNGVDTVKFNPHMSDREKIRNEYNIGADDLVMGMLARFSPGKGHEEFLEAARELCGKYKHLKFMIVGEASRGEDEYADHIKKMANDYIPGNVIFTGFRKDTPDILHAMDIFVFPSHSEAFGIALIEAMAMERASVASRTDGILDIAIDGETSLLFEKGNAVDLKEKLETLIENRDLREKMGKAARERTIENFEIELLSQRVIDFYKEYLNK